ncbi:hypothetical protein ACFVP0_21570 [Streptomyces cinereoruber]
MSVLVGNFAAPHDATDATGAAILRARAERAGRTVPPAAPVLRQAG